MGGSGAAQLGFQKEDPFRNVGRFTTSLPRKGIIRSSLPGHASFRQEKIPAPSDPCDAFKTDVEECRQRFRSRPVTPQSNLAFGKRTWGCWPRKCAGQAYEDELNRLEPDDKKEVPSKARYHRETYRLNATLPQVATRSAAITLRSFYYLNEQDGGIRLASVAFAFGHRALARRRVAGTRGPRVGRSYAVSRRVPPLYVSTA